ncbi:MAG: hypothetical protein R3B70_20270 [Polyangiaceae bacterium]
MSPARLRAALAVLCCAVLACLCERDARAEQPRPPDAPLPSSKPADPPPLPTEYREIDQDGIRFAYHPSARERIRALFDRAGAIRSALSERTGTPVLERVEVRVAAVPAEMVSLAPGEVPASAETVTFFPQRLIVMSVLSPTASAPLDVQTALTHALAHLALDEAAAGAPVPPWFHEGFAVHAEGFDLTRSRKLIDAALFGDPSSLDELSRTPLTDDLSRAEAADFVHFLTVTTPRPGPSALAALLGRLRQGEPFEVALPESAGAPTAAALESRWREHRARRHAFLPVLFTLLAAAALGTAAARWLARTRRARKSAAAAAARPRRDRPTAQPRPLRAPAKVAAAARLAAGRGKDAAIHIPRDPEVPKVEHNGEWHTLH